MQLVKALKFFVKTYAKASKALLDREKAGINLGFHRIRGEDFGLQNPDVPIPWFSKDLISPDSATSASAAIFDLVFWIAVREAKAETEKAWLEEVWQLFASKAIDARSRMFAVLSAMDAGKRTIQGGHKRGIAQRVAAESKYKEYREYFINYHLHNPRPNYSTIVMLTAQYFGVSKKTISRATATIKF